MSRYGCKCCGEGTASMKLRFIIQKLKDRLPSECEIINHSCFRCELNNINSGGEDDSQHLQGNALDFHVTNLYYLDLYFVLLEIGEICGIGVYTYSTSDKWFIHIDCEGRSGRRWMQIDEEYVDFTLERTL